MRRRAERTRAGLEWSRRRPGGVLRQRAAALAASALLVLAAPGCSEPPTPEEEIRAALERFETAAEEGELDVMTEFVSPGYRDASGRDRDGVISILAYHTLRRRAVHLLHLVRSIELHTPDEARVDVLVAMAGTPIDYDRLAQLDADFYRFDVELERSREGAWQTTGAEWRRIRSEDFF